MTQRKVYGEIAQFTHLEGKKHNVSRLIMMVQCGANECCSPGLLTYCEHDQCTVRLHVPIRWGDTRVTVVKDIWINK